MADRVATALEVLPLVRRSRGYRELEPHAQRALDADLRRIEARLGDAYALDVADLQSRLRGGESPPAPQREASPPPPPSPPPTPPAPRQQMTEVIGQRGADAIGAVDFPGFVASLLTGTFQAIVDASVKQIREYAQLVASISQTLEDFSQEHVTPNQVRDNLAAQFPQDLTVVLPRPGTAETPRLLPRPGRAGQSPAWLARFDLAGAELSEELTEGPLLQAGQLKVGEDRMQTLATMVLMGINRVVVDQGHVRAKVQFHAEAFDKQHAELQQQGVGVVGRNVGTDSATQMMVSTLKANAQADASIKTNLMGEVRISFRSETFPLERFADTAAIQLINRHARWKEPAADNAATPPPATSPSPATGPPPDAGPPKADE